MRSFLFLKVIGIFICSLTILNGGKLTMSSERICHECRGSKKCSTCKGSGNLGKKECPVCNGTGKCQSCKPRGWCSGFTAG